MAEALHGELLALRQRLEHDTPFWTSNCATILDEGKRPVKLVPRPWQARTPETPAHIVPLDEALEKQRAAGRPMRAIILKARKLGFSTWVQAKFMQSVTLQPFQYAVTVAHLKESVGPIADMARLMYDRLPNDHELAELIYGPRPGRTAPFSIKPQIVGEGQSRQGTRWISLGSKQRPSEASVYTTMTAGAKGGGRASTPSRLHLSEAAHYEDPEFIVGILNAVPKEPGTIVVIESTARGFNDFHTRWERAVDGAEDPETGGLYVPLFYGWQDNPRNALAFISEEARLRFEATIGDPDGGGDEEEVDLVEAFGCTLEQLRWRRVTMDEECGGKLEIFHQEHPATPEQAFIGSGNPVFPGIQVAKMIRATELAPEPVQGVLRGDDWETKTTRAGTIRIPRTALWVPGAEITPEDIDVWGVGGRLKVWEHPTNDFTQRELPAERRRPDSQHVTFADVATGEGNTQGDGDYHAIQVLDHVTRMQVAVYRSRIPLSDLPLVLVLIGTYFNLSWVAPEVNGPGIAVVDALKDYRYRRIYRRKRAGDDQRTDQKEYLLGWQTDTRTKPLMEATFGTILKEGVHGIRDPQTAREFTTYVENPKNPVKHGAQPGSHDDLAISAMGVHRIAAELKPRDPDAKRAGTVKGGQSVRGRSVRDQ